MSAGQMDQYCKENEFEGWFETSAKDNVGIDKAAKFLISKILENRVTERPPEQTLNLNAKQNAQENESSGGCCK